MRLGIERISQLWTGLLALKIQLEIKSRHSRLLCLFCYFKPDTGPRGDVSTEHALCYACLVDLGQNCETATYLSCQPASQPATSTIIHAHYFFLHDQISYLPTATKLVSAVGLSPGKLMEWRESECNDNCAQDRQHCSYAALAVLRRKYSTP